MHTDMCTTDFICRKERRIFDVHPWNFCLAWIQSALNLCFSIHMILESVMWIMRGWAALQSDRCAFALLIEAFPLLSCQPIAVVFIISRIFFRDSSIGLSNMCMQWCTQKIFMGGVWFRIIWWSFVFGVRCLWRHSLKSCPCFQTNVLATFADIIMHIFLHALPLFHVSLHWM